MFITGQIDSKKVFETFKPFEDKIVTKARQEYLDFMKPNSFGKWFIS